MKRTMSATGCTKTGCAKTGCAKTGCAKTGARRAAATLLLLAALPLVAQAGSFAGSSAGASSAGSSASSGSSSGDDKVVLQARDDAASFVASDGRIRSARLEAALRELRRSDADARRASDRQLALAILAR